MGNENGETPPPYDLNGKGFIGEGRGAPWAPIKDEPVKDEKEKAPVVPTD